MKRKILYILTIAIFAALAGIIYLNAITFHGRVRRFVSAEVEKATGKKFFIQSVRLNILKGIVLDGPVLYDRNAVQVRAKEIRCGFFLPSILRKKFIIPEITIESPLILVERRADGSFNIAELISREYFPKHDIGLNIYKILMKNGRVEIADRTLKSPFAGTIEDVDIDITPALPEKIKFNLKGRIRQEAPAAISLSGEYLILRKESNIEITAGGISLKEYADYYRNSGFSFPDGVLDAKMTLGIKEGMIDCSIDTSANDLKIHKDNIDSIASAAMKALVRFESNSGQFKYSGDIDIHRMEISGIDATGKLEDISGRVNFDNLRFSSDNLKLKLFGIPWRARINVFNFANPILDFSAVTEEELTVLRKTLEDNLGINIPIDITGKSNVDFSLQIETGKTSKLNGRLRLDDAMISLGGESHPIEYISGEAWFTSSDLKWEGLGLTYRGRAYKASGVLTNFSSPGVQLEIVSDDLSFKSIFALDGRSVILTQLKGRYLNSGFSATGQLDFEDPDNIGADISGVVDLELKDLDSIAKDKDLVKKMKPGGRLNLEFIMKGEIGDVRTCNIIAKITKSRASLYGLELEDLNMDYAQEEGAGHIRSMSSSFYGGSISATGKVNWFSGGLPYLITLNAKDVKLEKLKKDTGIKDKDVGGDIKLYASLNGYLKDHSRTSGLGRITITKGKLWSLDLFKGLGMLIFTSDFNYIVFAEGSCDFKIRDKAFFTNDFVLQGDLIKLYGSGRIGFDKSIAASLKAELDEEAMYPGFKKNIASCIGKYTFIEVTGTLAEPKYTVKPSVSDIVEDFASVFAQQ